MGTEGGGGGPATGMLFRRQRIPEGETSMPKREPKGTPELEALEAGWKAFITKPFPRPTPDPALDDLHADLAEYHAHVAGYVFRTIKGERFLIRPFGPDRRVEKKMRRLLRQRPDLEPALREYQGCYNEIQQVIALAETVRKQRH